MYRTVRGTITIFLLATLVAGCVSMGPPPAEQILGRWKTSVGEFPLVVEYQTDKVQVGTAAPVFYSLSGDELTYADGGSQVRIVSFPEVGQMIQLDPVTGTEHRFVKLP